MGFSSDLFSKYNGLSVISIQGRLRVFQYELTGLKLTKLRVFFH